MKKFASLVLTVVLLATMFCVFAVPASAESGTDGNINWRIDDTTLTISAVPGTNGEMKDYDDYDLVPWYLVDGKYSYETITNIIIEKGVVRIGKYAFAYFNKIESVVVPSSVYEIGEWAFYNCKNLKNVWIKGCNFSRLDVKRGAFKCCYGLNALAIGTVKGDEQSISLGYEAFENCNDLKYVFLSKAITHISEEAFCDDSKIETVYYGGDSDSWNGITIWGWNTYLTDKNRSYLMDFCKYYSNDVDTYLPKCEDGWPFNEFPFNLFEGYPGGKFDGWKCDINSYWREYPNGEKAYESTFTKWSHSDTECWRELPDGSRRYVQKLEWKSDEAIHYKVLPDGKIARKTPHSVKDGVCTVCGMKDPLVNFYTDENGKYQKIPEGFKSYKAEATLKDGWYVVDRYWYIGTDPITIDGDVKLILKNGIELSLYWGIAINNGKKLTIYSETVDLEDGNNMGKLTIWNNCLSEGVGICGKGSGNMSITICGGNIDSASGYIGAGIGVSNYTIDRREEVNQKVDVTIYNGNIIAYGNQSAGIGGNTSSVTIYGGRVRAYGTRYYPGIEGGNSFVKIHGGDVFAQGGQYACGITGKTVSVSDKAHVEAHGYFDVVTDYKYPDIDNQVPYISTVLSEGNIWIIVAVAVVVVAGVVVLVIVKKKKKKPALASGTENTDEE